MGKDELEVRREDQDKINKFSRLHQREMLLEEELKIKAVGIFPFGFLESPAHQQYRRIRKT